MSSKKEKCDECAWSRECEKRVSGGKCWYDSIKSLESKYHVKQV